MMDIGSVIIIAVKRRMNYRGLGGRNKEENKEEGNKEEENKEEKNENKEDRKKERARGPRSIVEAYSLYRQPLRTLSRRQTSGGSSLVGTGGRGLLKFISSRFAGAHNDACDALARGPALKITDSFSLVRIIPAIFGSSALNPQA